MTTAEQDELLLSVKGDIQAMCAEIEGLKGAAKPDDVWLDAKASAKYMCISPGSFDKYRFSTSPKIKGFTLDGKTLFKRSDLDAFIKLYEIRSGGL